MLSFCVVQPALINANSDIFYKNQGLKIVSTVSLARLLGRKNEFTCVFPMIKKMSYH